MMTSDYTVTFHLIECATDIAILLYLSIPNYTLRAIKVYIRTMYIHMG